MPDGIWRPENAAASWIPTRYVLRNGRTHMEEDGTWRGLDFIKRLFPTFADCKTRCDELNDEEGHTSAKSDTEPQ